MSAQDFPDNTPTPVSVYRAPNNRAYAPPPPEHDNFEPTSAELREAFASVIQQRNGPNAPLMTSAMRARQEAASGRIKKQFDTVRIRVRFSDRTQIEHTFPHTATIDDVYTMVDSTLHEGGQGDYVLFQSPPKRDFPRNQIRTTLVQLGFAPAAVLGIRWADPKRNATDAPAPLRSDVAARARDMPLPPSFTTQIPSVRPNGSDGAPSDAQQAREKRKFPKSRDSIGQVRRDPRDLSWANPVSFIRSTDTMSLANTLYNTFVLRNSVYVGTIFTGAFLFGIGFDTATQMWWDRHNKGKQWADIRDKCIKMADGGDDDE